MQFSWLKKTFFPKPLSGQLEGMDGQYWPSVFREVSYGVVVDIGGRDAYYQSMKTTQGLMDRKIETSARENSLLHFVFVLSTLQATQADGLNNLWP